MAVTQKQIAEKLGVSYQLVGLALNGHPGVAEKTRLKIAETAREMGYGIHSNREARALAAKRHGRSYRNGVLAVLSPVSWAVASMRREPFYSSLMEGVEGESEKRELDIFYCSWRNDKLPRIIMEGGVDGVFAVYITPKQARFIAELGIRVVTYDNVNPWGHSIMPDSRAGICQAVQHLHGLGHRRIAYLGPHPVEHFSQPQMRLEGYAEGMRSCGLTDPQDLMHFPVPAVDDLWGYDVHALLGTGPGKGAAPRPAFTALICFSDLLALDVMGQLRGAGLEVPRDISIVGFDNVPLSATCSPPLTTIHYDRVEMGEFAVQLLERLNENRDEPVREHYFPTTLLVRSSTAKYRKKVAAGRN